MSVGVGDGVGGVGVGLSVSVGLGVGVGVGDSVGVGVASAVVGITDGNGCGGGGSEPRRAHNAVIANAATVANASHVQMGLSLAAEASSTCGASAWTPTGGSGAVSPCGFEPTGAIGSVGSWSAMRPG